jgi:hypothetical protein
MTINTRDLLADRDHATRNGRPPERRGYSRLVAPTKAEMERLGHLNQMGEPVYQRLGYRELYPYRVQFARTQA